MSDPVKQKRSRKKKADLEVVVSVEVDAVAPVLDIEVFHLDETTPVFDRHVDAASEPRAPEVLTKTGRNAFLEKIKSASNYEIYFRNKKIYDSVTSTGRAVPTETRVIIGNVHYPYNGLEIKFK